MIALLHDMDALGIEPPQDSTEVADDLESELRAGKLAALKQQTRAIRLQAVTRLKAGLPQYISEYGDYLLGERAHGIATELEAIELARGAGNSSGETGRRGAASSSTPATPWAAAEPTGARRSSSPLNVTSRSLRALARTG